MPDLLNPAVEKPVVPAHVEDEHPLESDEASIEVSTEKLDSFLEEESKVTPLPEKAQEMAVSSTAAVAPTVPKDEVTLEVEKVLESGLGEMYAKLPPEAKEKFKEKGEEASKEIGDMVRGLQIKVKRALELIRNWLLVIPGVNKFFLEQEAKIKVDLLVALVETRKNDPTKLP